MLRREKNNCSQRDTRWDRIRKRYSNSSNASNGLKTDMIKKLIEMDFVGKHNERMLTGEETESLRYCNPVMVMDMRHEVFKKIHKGLPLATVEQPQHQLEACIAHNISVEEHYIEHELKKFRSQLEKNYKRNQLNLKGNRDIHKIDNSHIKRSLLTSTMLIEDIYRTPIAALNESLQLTDFKETSDLSEKNDVSIEHQEVEKIDDKYREAANDNSCCNLRKTEFQQNDGTQIVKAFALLNESTYTNEIDVLTDKGTYLSDNGEDMMPSPSQARSVQFENVAEVWKFERETSNCSNTSDGIDSVISDIAGEALIELQLEEQEKLKAHLPKEAVSDSEAGKDIEEPERKEALTIKRLELSVNPREKIIIKDLYSPSSSDGNEESSTAHSEKNQIVEQLFLVKTHTRTATLRKYFLKWIHYTTMEKIERDNCKSSKQDRAKRINAFLDKVRQEKLRQIKNKSQDNESEGCGVNERETKTSRRDMGNVMVAKKYKNKIKIQQDIIDYQRVKLERQERLIMQLKLHKLSEEAKEARDDIKNELKAVISYGDPKSKAKAKCLQLIGNMRDAKEKDEFERLTGKALLVPKFLQNMQARALERSIKHEQAKQRRLQQEAEREAQKIAAEEAKRLEDEEVKRMRIEVLKEKRRQEKMAKIIKERERQRCIENHHKAQQFCRLLLLRRVGMEGFKRLLQRKVLNRQKSEAFRSLRYKRICFQAWRSFVATEIERKLEIAITYCNQLSKRNALEAWKEYANEQKCKLNVAKDWYELKLSEQIFKIWITISNQMRLIEDIKMQQASAHHEWHLKWKVLTCWQRLPQILQIEKETEERRQRWRLKIWELLPDYSPNRDDLN